MREALDAEGDEVGHARRRVAAALDVEADELVDVERRHAGTARLPAASAGVAACDGAARPSPCRRARRPSRARRRPGGQARRAGARRRASRARSPGCACATISIAASGGSAMTSAKAARLDAVDGVEIVDGEDRPRLRGGRLVGADHRPAERLGGDEAAILGREAAGGGLRTRSGAGSRCGSPRRRDRRGRGAPRGWRAAQSRGAAAVGREAGELDDRACGGRSSRPRPTRDRGRSRRRRRPRRRRGARNSCKRRVLPTPCSPTMRTAASDPLTSWRQASSHSRSSSRAVKGTGRRGRLERRWRPPRMAATVPRAGGRARQARRARRSRRRTSARAGRSRRTRRRRRRPRRARSGPTAPSVAASATAAQRRRRTRRRSGSGRFGVLLERLQRDLDEAPRGCRARGRRRSGSGGGEREVHQHHLRRRVGLEREAAR